MQVLVYSQRDKSQIHEMAGHVFSQQEKMKRALKKLGLFWGIAVLSVFAPVVHFVLVPAFLLLGPFLAAKTYREEVILEACDLPCPECGKTSHFDKISGQWPLTNGCEHCRNRIYFDLASSHQG